MVPETSVIFNHLHDREPEKILSRRQSYKSYKTTRWFIQDQEIDLNVFNRNCKCSVVSATSYIPLRVMSERPTRTHQNTRINRDRAMH